MSSVSPEKIVVSWFPERSREYKNVLHAENDPGGMVVSLLYPSSRIVSFDGSGDGRSERRLSVNVSERKKTLPVFPKIALIFSVVREEEERLSDTMVAKRGGEMLTEVRSQLITSSDSIAPGSKGEAVFFSTATSTSPLASAKSTFCNPKIVRSLETRRAYESDGDNFPPNGDFNFPHGSTGGVDTGGVGSGEVIGVGFTGGRRAGASVGVVASDGDEGAGETFFPFLPAGFF